MHEKSSSFHILEFTYGIDKEVCLKIEMKQSTWWYMNINQQC